MMTSLAFILGVVPLVISAGAGAEMRQTLGTAVFSGMLGVTLFGIFLTPVFYYVIQWVSDKRSEPAERRSDRRRIALRTTMADGEAQARLRRRGRGGARAQLGQRRLSMVPTGRPCTEPGNLQGSMPWNEPPCPAPGPHVILVEPEIAANTGAIGRTCVAAGATLWLVRPLGFHLDDRHLRRAGLDYWEHLDLRS